MNPDWQAFLTNQGLTTNTPFELDTRSGTNSSPGSLCATDDYSILTVSGEDAASFLQGQTSCDVLGLSNGRATHGAFCNPKGRVISNFVLFFAASQYWLIVPSELAAPIEKRLRMYILRSQVNIENVTDTIALFGIRCIDLPVIMGHDQPSKPSIYPLIDANEWQLLKFSTNQWIFIGNPTHAIENWMKLASSNFKENSAKSWRLHCIVNGIPRLGTLTSEAFVPQMINLDALDGISFEKGCYTGQEIVARMHYLGKLKRRMYLAKSKGGRLPDPGEPVYTVGNPQSVGQVVNAESIANNEKLMLVVLQIDQAQSDTLHFSEAADLPIKILELPYTF